MNSNKTVLSAVSQAEEKSHAHSRRLINARKEAKLSLLSLACTASAGGEKWPRQDRKQGIRLIFPPFGNSLGVQYLGLGTFTGEGHEN